MTVPTTAQNFREKSKLCNSIKPEKKTQRKQYQSFLTIPQLLNKQTKTNTKKLKIPTEHSARSSNNTKTFEQNQNFWMVEKHHSNTVFLNSTKLPNSIKISKTDLKLLNGNKTAKHFWYLLSTASPKTSKKQQLFYTTVKFPNNTKTSEQSQK